MALGLGNNITLSGYSKPIVNYYNFVAFDFNISGLSGSDYTEANTGTSTYSFDMDHNNDNSWYIYDGISSVDTAGGSYTTTKVKIQYEIQIGDEGGTDSNKFNVYLADTASGTQTLLKAYTNADNTGGAYITEIFELESGSFDSSNDYFVIKDNASSSSADWDFTIKNISVNYYGTLD